MKSRWDGWYCLRCNVTHQTIADVNRCAAERYAEIREACKNPEFARQMRYTGLAPLRDVEEAPPSRKT